MHNTVLFDRDLIERYDRKGPRYTSYPVATQFHSHFKETQYVDAVAQSNEDPIPSPLSLYLHIPFCATVCFYCACNKIITANRSRAEEYLQHLLVEIGRQGALFDRTRRVEQLHLGGGTPTYLSREQLQRLMHAVKQGFSLVPGGTGEFSIEVDPRTVNEEDIWHLRATGFNRISLGVQDLDPEVQRAINRFQPPAQSMGAIRAARNAGFQSVSIDLIYGLPRQSVESFERTLEMVVDAEPDRISVFNYAHLPDVFKVQRQIDERELPTPAEKLCILARTVARLTDAGYIHVGMDHFAKPDDELAIAQRNGRLARNFQGYSTHGDCDIVGLGVSAISSVGNTYSQNERDLSLYQTRIAKGELAVSKGLQLNADDQLRRAVIQQLICHFHLDYAGIEDRFGVDFRRYFAVELAALEGMREDGLLDVNARGINVLPPGRLLIRNICMMFDRYLKGEAQNLDRYSRVV